MTRYTGLNLRVSVAFVGICQLKISEVKDNELFTSLFQRMNMESRKSPKLSRANQEGQRSPRLPTKKPPVRSPSLTRREFSMDGITEVQICTI